MIGKMVSWLNRKMEGEPVKNGAELYDLLRDRSSMEITARLLYRAQLFEE